MEHFNITSIPKLFVIPSTNHTMSNGETSTAESTEVTGSTTACSSVSATTSETKRMGKFKFLTIPSASENSSSQPLSSETVSSSSPHHMIEPTSTETFDERFPSPKFSRRGSATSSDYIGSRHSPAPSELNSGHPESSQHKQERKSPRGHTDDDDLINKHVKRLLKVTDLRDQIPDTEDDFEEEDDDFESRLDQMIAEEDQNKKKPRRRATSRGSAVRRRSTRNTVKPEDKPASPAKSTSPVKVTEVAGTMSASSESLLNIAMIPLPPKPGRGRRKKTVLTDQPISLPNGGIEHDSLTKDRLQNNDIVSDDTASQTSEVKDNEDMADQNRPRKLKNRWAEKATFIEPPSSEEPSSAKDSSKVLQDITEAETNRPTEDMTPTPYETIPECIRLAKHKMREDREARKMRCDCMFSAEEASLGMKGCTEGHCLNRMLYIECGPKCAAKDFCSNKRFQRNEYSAIEVFNAGSSKGHGIRAKHPIFAGQFICEYIGEILDQRQFKKRQKEYDKINLQHHYSMALNSEEVIDATKRGNIMRFTNHSCDPNAETQKWTVNGQLRIGFFALRPIMAGDEITIDYQFERYGKKAQRCYCGSVSCRGFIGSVSDDKKRVAKGEISDRKMVSEIDKFLQLGSIRTEDQALRMARLLLRVEDDNDRLTLLNVIQNSEQYPDALRAFLRCQGLTILAALMFSCQNSRLEIKLEILNTLGMLPVLSRNALETSRVLFKVKEWAGRRIETEGASAAAATALAQAMVEKVDAAPPLIESAEMEVAIKEEKMDVEKMDLSPTHTTTSVPEDNSVSPVNGWAGDKMDVDCVTMTVGEEISDSSLKVLPREEPEEEPSSDRVAPVIHNVEHCSEVKQRASDLLESWDNLKMIFKIPRKINQDPEPTSSQFKVYPPKPGPSIWGDSGNAISVLGTSSTWPARPFQDLIPPGPHDYYNRKRPRYPYRGFDTPDKKLMTQPADSTKPMSASTWNPPSKAVDEPAITGFEELTASVDYKVMLAEQIRQNTELAAEMVSQKLLDGSVALSQKANIVLLDGTSHDVRTFQPTEEQVQQIIKAIPVIGSKDWTEKYATVLHYTQGRNVNVEPLDAPKVQNFMGWTSNFDLSKQLFVPKDWSAAYDRVGRLYFYNVSNGVSRWDFPVEDKEYSTVLQQLPPAVSIPADIMKYTKVLTDTIKVTPWSPQGDDELEDKTTPPKRSASSTPHNKPKVDPTKIAQSKEHNREVLKKKKIDFQNDVCQFVLHYLNSYRTPECTQGRIDSKEDFKYLARKFTHNVVEQEVQRHRNSPEALIFSSRHKPKIKEHIKKYMSRFGRTYKGPSMVNGTKDRTKIDSIDHNGDGCHQDEEMFEAEKDFDEGNSNVEIQENLLEVKQNGFSTTPDEEMEVSILMVSPNQSILQPLELTEGSEGRSSALD